jgi:hypothetical protein
VGEYVLAGVPLRVITHHPVVTALVEGRLASLGGSAFAEPDPGVAGVEVEIRGPAAPTDWPPAPAGPGRVIYDAPSGPIEYFEDTDQIYVDYEARVRLLCDPTVGRAQLAITGTDPGAPTVATHPLFNMALFECMKRRGRFAIHAASASRQGRGVLVPGTSGAGKSTLSLTLVRSGFDFLSDDTVFASADPSGFTVAAFPDEVDATPNTVALLPELAYLADRPIRPGREKHAFRVEDVYGITPVAACTPVAVLSPRLEVGAPPELAPLALPEALRELTLNLLLTEPASTQAHLDLLAGLVRSVPCYTLRTGGDFDEVAACVADLVDRA